MVSSDCLSSPMKRAPAAVATLLLCCIAIAAQEDAPVGAVPDASATETPLITDRPDFTESPQTIPRKYKAQIEAGYTFARVGAAKESSLGEVLVRVPLTEKFEARFGIPDFAFQRFNTPAAGERASGLTDAFIGGKVALAAGDSGRATRPAIGLLFGTSLPTGNRSFRENKLQPEVAIALATQLDPRFALSSNIGYARASDGSAGFDRFFGTISLGFDLPGRFAGYVEAYGFTRTEAATRASARFANGGVTFLVNNNFQLDARIGTGIGNDTAPDYFLGFGFARRF